MHAVPVLHMDWQQIILTTRNKIQGYKLEKTGYGSKYTMVAKAKISENKMIKSSKYYA